MLTKPPEHTIRSATLPLPDRFPAYHAEVGEWETKTKPLFLRLRKLVKLLGGRCNGLPLAVYHHPKSIYEAAKALESILDTVPDEVYRNGMVRNIRAKIRHVLAMWEEIIPANSYPVWVGQPGDVLYA